MHHEQEVQLIAYHMWEEEGHPHGHDLEHWLKAEAAWQEKHAQVEPAVQQVAVAHKPTSAIQAKDARTQTQPRLSAR
jgi:hypothetical protein